VRQSAMGIDRYPKFDRFCRFIAATEKALSDIGFSPEPDALVHGRERWMQALTDSGLSDLTWNDVLHLNTHMNEANRELRHIDQQLRDLQQRHGISHDLSLQETLDRVPKSDLVYATMMHDIESFLADAIEAWRRLGREGQPSAAFALNVPPDQRAGILAYGLRNGMFE